ncbi:protein mono-ADP-ribosyltransferase PARP9 [Paralichthys olivaceus]|uniref:protein mono-ADP-ribosyltransferase PARP9 n=1 Tax=Paralichthys olivaceus TaxID=8255 RepID=UPI0037518629
MASKLDITLQGPSVNIVRQCGPALSDILQSKFGCTAIFAHVASESVPTFVQQQKTFVPEKKFGGVLRGGIKLSVWKDDLANVRVDAVVNAANIRLQHYGGLAQVLSRVGGQQIQKESDDYIRRMGELKTGDAIVCGAGLLPCKKIIHAVGPCLPLYPTQSEVNQANQLLKRTITSILDKVKENNLKNVAIPAISSGLFNFPLPVCANTIVSTVKEYYDKNSYGHLPEEILLVNNDDPSVNEMERACCEIFSPKLYSKVAGAGAGAGAGAAKNSTSTVQIGAVQLTLKWGKIEEQETDVIVNTASADRDLGYGVISKALLKKAGHGLQQELCRNKKNGSVIVTKGYSLQCKEVFHTFCSATRAVLFKSVLDCLYIAVSNNHRSISFPAIGTGGLGFSKTEVAQIMSAAVEDFAKKSPQALEVHFVIFPLDKDTYKAFEEAMRSLPQKASKPGFTQELEHRDNLPDGKPAAPQISLHGSSESIFEAEQWLRGLFKSSDTVTIRNNFIQHFGEQEHLKLAHLSSQKTIDIEESFDKGHADITVYGDSCEDIVVAALQVEAMLCNIQREFVREEERAMLPFSTEKVTFERTPVDNFNDTFSKKSSVLKKEGLHMLKLEKVANPTLKMMFEEKKKQLQCFTPQTMFQCIPAQFCEMVSHVGFHAEYAPPADPAYGEGIYFAGTARKAMEVWKNHNEKYVYLVEAEVLTGNSTPGRPGLILPVMGTNSQMISSVSGGPDISVIFSGYQALPKYILTCVVG